MSNLDSKNEMMFYKVNTVYFDQIRQMMFYIPIVSHFHYMSQCFRFTGPGCMSTNTIIVTCNAVLSLLATFLTLLPCTKKTTGGVVPAALQAAIGRLVYINRRIKIMCSHQRRQGILQLRIS